MDEMSKAIEDGRNLLQEAVRVFERVTATEDVNEILGILDNAQIKINLLEEKISEGN